MRNLILAAALASAALVSACGPQRDWRSEHIADCNERGGRFEAGDESVFDDECMATENGQIVEIDYTPSGPVYDGD